MWARFGIGEPLAVLVLGLAQHTEHVGALGTARLDEPGG